MNALSELVQHVPSIGGYSSEVVAAATATVLLAGFIRLYAGSVVFHPRYVAVWDVIRAVGSRVIQRLVYAYIGQVEVENDAVRDEYVGRIAGSNITTVAKRLNEVADPEVPLLAGYKTDWEGREEIGTLVFHRGPEPWPTAPRWLRKYQLHMTFFYDSDAGEIIVTAHFEANSYRPDMWVDHLSKGASFSVERGVRLASLKLEEAELDWEPGGDSA